jgi:predicted transcriptional regulator
MNNRESSREVDRHLVVRIVTSYVKHNKVATNDLPVVITWVHQSLTALGKSPVPVESRTPAVPVRRSVEPEYVVCLECGFRGLTLRRHLRAAHGLDPAAYYARWRLAADHPITAPSYSARRSAMARELGLGRGRGRRRAAGSASQHASRSRRRASQRS